MRAESGRLLRRRVAGFCSGVDTRDWDVFVTETLPQISQACSEVEGFDAVEAVAESQRRKARERARTAMADPRTGRFQIALGLWIEQKGLRADASPEGLRLLVKPARGFAAEILEKLHRNVLKRGRDFRKLSPRKRHKVRVALKKLRYAADFFLPLLGKKRARRRYAKNLARLQKQLGRYNDVFTLEALVQRLNRKKMPVAGSRAVGVLHGWQAGSLDRDDADLLSAWKRFQSVELP